MQGLPEDEPVCPGERGLEQAAQLFGPAKHCSPGVQPVRTALMIVCSVLSSGGGKTGERASERALLKRCPDRHAQLSQAASAVRHGEAAQAGPLCSGSGAEWYEAAQADLPVQI